MTNFAERLAAWWRNANGTQRALVVGGVIAGIASAASVVLWSSQPDYVVLFSGLDDETASQIVDELDESGVPFEVSRSGGTVRVPSDRVGELRLRIAGKGLTGGGTMDGAMRLVERQGGEVAGIVAIAIETNERTASWRRDLLCVSAVMPGTHWQAECDRQRLASFDSYRPERAFPGAGRG
jgi:hypothetical protein